MSARDDLIDVYGRAEAGTAPWSLAEFRQALDRVAAEAARDAAAKDTPAPGGGSTLPSGVLDMLAAIRDALTLPADGGDRP